MKNSNISLIAGGVLGTGLLLSPTAAFAQDDAQQTASDDDMNAPSDPDPHPTPPGLEASGEFEAEMERQAGTGGDVAYASKGVVEIGGHGSAELADAFTNVSIRPFAGWFVTDNLQLSGILEFGWSEVEFTNPLTDETDSESSTLFGLYAEPSYHMPFSDRMLGFLGVGLGPTYDSQEFGFAVRPRLGMDFLVGRSGIFRPALEVTYSTVDVVSRNNQNLVGVSTTYGISFGFSTML